MSKKKHKPHKHMHPHHDVELPDPSELEDEPRRLSAPMKYILAVFLVLLMVVMIFPIYSVKLDPTPKDVPTRQNILDMLPQQYDNQKIDYGSRQDYKKFVTPTDSTTKRMATRIVSASCESGKRVCHAKALYEFVRDEIDYVADPVGDEYVETGHELILNGGGDCESGTLLLASLMEASGINAEMVFIPGHAFLRIKLPEAVNRYKMDEDWVYLDWTCNNCEFGEIPWKNVDIEASYMDV